MYQYAPDHQEFRPVGYITVNWVFVCLLSSWKPGQKHSSFAAKKHTKICFWEHFSREIGNAETESWFIFDHHSIVWRYDLTVRVIPDGFICTKFIKPYPLCATWPDLLFSIENVKDLYICQLIQCVCALSYASLRLCEPSLIDIAVLVLFLEHHNWCCFRTIVETDQACSCDVIALLLTWIGVPGTP